MNINQANTIPMKMFDYEHGALNRLVKVTTASLHYLAHESIKGNAPPLTQIFDAYVPYWGNPPIAEMTSVERDIFVEELSRMSAIRVISALDHYITSISSELNSINSMNNILPTVIEEQDTLDNDKPISIFNFAKQLGLNFTEEQVSLISFITVLRNCCAHRAGHASRKLVALIANDHLIKALNIKSDEGKKVWAATFPQLRIGDKIALSPVHAI